MTYVDWSENREQIRRVYDGIYLSLKWIQIWENVFGYLLPTDFISVIYVLLQGFCFLLFKTGIFCSFYPNFVSLDSKQFCDSVSRLVSDNSGALAEKMIDSRRGYNDSRGEGTMKVQCAWRGCTGGTIQMKTYSVSTILVCQRSTINRSHIVYSQEIGGQIFRISSNSLKMKPLQTNASFIDIQCYQSLSINWLVDHLSETLHRFVINWGEELIFCPGLLQTVAT